MIYCHADAIGAFYHPQMVTSESHMRTDGYDDARSESSHHCPKSRQGAVANDVEIERIGTSHTTVSQQAEQVRVVTGQRATWKDDRSRRKVVCRSAKAEQNYMSNQRLQLQSRIINESQYQFGDRSYTATEPRWQSTINMMEKSSTEQRIFKEGDSRVYTIKSYRQYEAHGEAVYRERNHEVDQMVTEADFQRRLPSQCHLPMTTD